VIQLVQFLSYLISNTINKLAPWASETKKTATIDLYLRRYSFSTNKGKTFDRQEGQETKADIYTVLPSIPIDGR
jgi:hypothetical protein